MFCRLSYLFIALTTFAVSTIVATFTEDAIFANARFRDIDSFHISNSSRYVDFAGRNGCLKKLGIKLGDSYSKVSEKVSLIPDYMGWNENGSWRFGKNTDFRGSLSNISLNKEERLIRWVYAEFDDHQRLLSISITWQIDDYETPELRKLAIDEVFNNQYSCSKPVELTVSSNDLAVKKQHRNYSEKLRVSKHTSMSIWTIKYTIQHRNSNWFVE